MSNEKKKYEFADVAGLWEVTSKKGNAFYASSKLSFGQLRAILKKFKEEEGVEDEDNIAFLLFECYSDHERAPKFNLKIKKDTYKKEG